MRRLYEWKYMNPPNNNTTNTQTNNSSTRNYPDQTANYKKLLAQIDSDKKYKYHIMLFTDRIISLDLSPNCSLMIKIVFKPYVPNYFVEIAGKDYYCKDYSEVLDLLVSKGIIKDKSLYTASSLTEELRVPSKLYHATYRQFLNSIKKKGLGNTKRKMWSDSKPGVVYLADDPWVAESYAEESEYIDSVEDPDDYLDNIIILEVDVSNLDSSKLYIDENVILDDGELNSTWEYHGVIPWEVIKIFNSSIAEDFEVYNNLWK